MSTVLPGQGSRTDGLKLPMAWLLAIAGFAALYTPLYWRAANGIWQTEDHGHGVIILMVLLWLFWTLRHEIDNAPVQPVPWLGWPRFVFGLLVCFVGRVFDISILTFASQPLVVAHCGSMSAPIQRFQKA